MLNYNKKDKGYTVCSVYIRQGGTTANTSLDTKTPTSWFVQQVTIYQLDKINTMTRRGVINAVYYIRMPVDNDEDLALLQLQIKNKKLQFTSAIRQNEGFEQAKVYLLELHGLEEQLKQYKKNNSIT